MQTDDRMLFCIRWAHVCSAPDCAVNRIREVETKVAFIKSRTPHLTRQHTNILGVTIGFRNNTFFAASPSVAKHCET
jgi:hypothetical protein